MALLIEHYNGKYPFWLNPRQIIVLTVNDEDSVLQYANSLVSFLRQDGSLVQAQELNENCPTRPEPEPEPEPRRIAAPSTSHNFAVDLDDTARSIKKKVRDAKTKHYSVIMVVGQDEATKASVNVDLSGITDSDGWIGKAAHFFSPRGSRRRGDNEVSRNGRLDVFSMLNKAGDELGPKELKNVSFENRHDIFDLLVGIQDRYL
jgi:threonyl-tRNA synthetase